MYSFSSTDGWYEGRPVTSGSTPLNPSSARSSSSTKTSITRTGLSSPIQSSRLSGNSVLCPRSAPSTKRFIRSSPQIVRESYRANHIKRSVFTQPGSNPVLRVFPLHVRLGAASGIRSGTGRCRSSANKRHRPASLDHLVDAEQKRLRHGDAKRFGSLEVDDQLEFGRLLHRQFTRASAFKYPINVSRGSAPRIR